MAGLNEKDKEYLRNNFGTKSIEEISEELNLNKCVVAQEARALNLKKRSLKKFGDKELEIIKKHYKYLTYGELGALLKRNRTVIFSKIKELGLDKKDEDLINFKNSINGYEDSIMFMYSNLKYSNVKIKKILDSLDEKNKISLEMIDSFLFMSIPTYKKNWKLFNKTI